MIFLTLPTKTQHSSKDLESGRANPIFTHLIIRYGFELEYLEGKVQVKYVCLNQ